MSPTSLRRLRRGVAVVQEADAVLFVNGQIHKRIRGTDAKRFVYPVANAARGRRTNSELASELGLPENVVLEVLQILDHLGLLESADLVGADLPEHIASFLEQSSATSGRYDDLAGAIELTANTAVLLVGLAEVGDIIEADLSDAGFGMVVAAHSYELPEEVWEAASGENHALAVVSATARDADIGAVLARCNTLGIPALLVQALPDSIEVGPVLLHGEGCWSCFARGRDALKGWEPEVEDAQRDRESTTLVAAGVLAAEILAITAELPTAQRRRALVRFTLPDFERVVYTVLPEPGCKICGTASATEPLPAAIECFEEMIAHGVSTAAQKVRHGPRYADRLIRNQHKRPSWTTWPRVARPAGQADFSMIDGRIGSGWVTRARAAPRPLDERAVFDLANLATGRREIATANSRRWTASGGSFGSAASYIIPTRPMFGRSPGTVLRYDDTRDQLIVIAVADPDQCLDAAQLGDSRPDLLWIIVADVERLSSKYGNFSLHLSHLDVGCATTQLAAVSAGHGWRLKVSRRWREELAQLIDLVPGSELIMSVLGVSGKEADDADR